MSDIRDIKLYIQDIIDSCDSIIEYVSGMDFDAFSNDRKTFSAVIREFEIIGEAVGKLPDSIKLEYPDVEWQDIKDFRNLLIHEYFGIDLEIVWNIIKDNLPELLETVKIINRLNS